MRSLPSLLIGCAAGFSGDRVDAAGPVVDTLIARLGGVSANGRAFLIFETLAERTLALAQLRKRADAQAGYEPRLAQAQPRGHAQDMARRAFRIGGPEVADDAYAVRQAARQHRSEHVLEPRIAVVKGDDVSGAQHAGMLAEYLGEQYDPSSIVSANAYLGSEQIRDALDHGAEIVVCGRVADPSLTVGPAMSYFGWQADDWDRIGRATMAGHLLECGAQVCGGYYADPGYKDVPGLEQVGFPVAEIDEDGHCIIGKSDGTGGLVDEATVIEQLLYEVHDPAGYLTPDVVADISQAEVRRVADNQVRLTGVRGHPRPAAYKVNVCLEGGWLAEGEISYAGPRAEARAPGRRGRVQAAGRPAHPYRPDRPREHFRRRRRTPAGRRAGGRWRGR
ncbi:acyclic terpene utilization AtuA family protein, partial [Bordetella pertussis]